MTIYCSIRKQLIEKTPEEEVRQALLQRMRALGYPESLTAVEKSLASMPHLLTKKLPDRRADIVVFSANTHPQFSLFPLLLIECKADALTSEVMRQVIGYNHYVRAPLIALANQQEIRTALFHNNEGWVFQTGLPSFEEAISKVLLNT